MMICIQYVQNLVVNHISPCPVLENQAFTLYSLFFVHVPYSPATRTEEDIELIYDELLHIRALRHLSNAVSRGRGKEGGWGEGSEKMVVTEWVCRFSDLATFMHTN